MRDSFHLRLTLTLFSVAILLGDCSPKKSTLDLEAYQAEIEAWHVKRVSDLKDTTGWLNLAGLYWLQEGINTFGSSERNQVVFPAGTIAEEAGYFLVKNGSVKMEVKTEAVVTVKGMPVTSVEIFHPDSSRAVTAAHGSLQWFVIRRDNQVGIRLRDLTSKAVQEFRGIERYPVNPDWRVEADFTPTEGKTIDITNVLGQTLLQASPGVLKFQLDGKDFSIDALDGGKDELFLIFGDPTNGNETYPSGRYLYVKRPDAEGKMVIDFNKAYNPPCAFTPYATCPLPPRQNVLTVAIEAGEKNYEGYEHNTH